MAELLEKLNEDIVKLTYEGKTDVKDVSGLIVTGKQIGRAHV